ncbi:MAG: heme-degrading domain-containing protein [Oliverpabstia sp.]|nr:heme-degrading domain-containing protein [Eubacterium sp.]
MTVEELVKVLEMQEEILQFSSFTNADAWELGNMVIQEAKRLGLTVAVRIRLNNGYTVFQYGMDGTNLLNEQWMTRKENTVKTLEESSLRFCMNLRANQESLEDHFLDPREYAACGGGFPIRVEEVGVIGTIVVSGLDHVSDHDLLVKCISKYLHVAEVPRIRAV